MNPAARSGATIALGPLLRDSLALLFRHWAIMLAGMFVLAEFCLLNLSLLGHCFGNATPACPSFVTTLGDRAEWLVTSVAHEAAAVVVSGVAIYLLYSSKRVDVPGAAVLRKSKTLAFRLFARILAVSIIILIPVHLFDMLLADAAASFMEFASAEMQWLVYIARIIVITAYAAYAHAGLALYVPSAAYSSEPETWRESWRRSRVCAGRLFILFFVVGGVASFAQVGLMLLAYRFPGYLAAVDFFSDILDVRSNYTLHNLGQAIAFVLVGVPGTLLEAAASLVAFKALMPAQEQATADIFD